MEQNLDGTASRRCLRGTYSEQTQDYHVEFLVYVKATLYRNIWTRLKVKPAKIMLVGKLSAYYCVCVCVGSCLATKVLQVICQRGWVIIRQASDEQRSTTSKSVCNIENMGVAWGPGQVCVHAWMFVCVCVCVCVHVFIFRGSFVSVLSACKEKGSLCLCVSTCMYETV